MSIISTRTLTINPGTKVDDAVKKLLSFVPDRLFIEGDTAYLVNPLPDDDSIYSYSTQQTDVMHQVVAGRYRAEAPDYSHIRVEGRGSSAGQPLIVNCYDYNAIEKGNTGFLSVEDLNLTSIDAGRSRGEILLHHFAAETVTGYIEIHPNCAQQVYDVITVTDSKAGLVNAKRRVTALKIVFLPTGGKYLQTLLLGKV